MMYEVKVKKKVLRNFEKVPRRIQYLFLLLIKDLKEKGPIQTEWPSFSKLGKEKYHCHLTHKYVACWNHERNTMILEVYYVGSRENAPY